MLLKYIQEGLSLRLKVHDTVLRFHIFRLSMHVPYGVLTDMMGMEDCCLGVGVGELDTCVYVCVWFEVRMRWGGGLPLSSPPLETRGAVRLALGLGTGGRYDVELGVEEQEEEWGAQGAAGLFQIFVKKTHTHPRLTRLAVSLAKIQRKKLNKIKK